MCLHMKRPCRQTNKQDNVTLLRSKSSFDLISFSFHIGTGRQNPTLFEAALQFAKEVFEIGIRLGFQMNVLDIGGGFPGSPRRAHPFHSVSII